MTPGAAADSTRRAIIARLAVSDARVTEAAEWIDEYRRFWTGMLAALEDFIKHKHQTTGKRKKQ